MDAMHWHEAESSHSEFFIANDMTFKSMGPVEVVQLSLSVCLKVHKFFSVFLSKLNYQIYTHSNSNKKSLCLFVTLVNECFQILILR